MFYELTLIQVIKFYTWIFLSSNAVIYILYIEKYWIINHAELIVIMFL